MFSTLRLNDLHLARNMNESEKAVVKEFLCSQCQLKVKYDYFGTKPPFAKSVMYVVQWIRFFVSSNIKKFGFMTNE